MTKTWVKVTPSEDISLWSKERFYRDRVEGILVHVDRWRQENDGKIPVLRRGMIVKPETVLSMLDEGIPKDFVMPCSVAVRFLGMSWAVVMPMKDFLSLSQEEEDGIGIAWVYTSVVDNEWKRGLTIL